MTLLKTKAYGEIQVHTEQLVSLKKALFGFEDYTQFFLLEMQEVEYFYWLQSAEDADLAFMLVNPRIFYPDYVLDVDEGDVALLEVESVHNIMDFAIVSIPGNDPKAMTMNLLGPVLVNTENHYAIQSISNRSDYGTKHAMLHVG